MVARKREMYCRLLTDFNTQSAIQVILGLGKLERVIDF